MDPLSHSLTPGDMQPPHMTRDQITLIADFGNTLEFCKIGLASSPYLSLPYNVDVLFGNAMARDFLTKQLYLATGKNVEVSISEDRLRTIVQFATDKVSSHYSLSPTVNASPATFTSRDAQQPLSANSPSSTSKDPEQPTSAARTASVLQKNPPRPMNCWLLFRDEKHKQLKQQHPHLTVQQISTICSMDWKKLTVAEKNIWKERASDAKTQHERMFPGYKYAPRKPGQKKKRQSRKVAHAARSTALLSESSTSGSGTNPTTTLPESNTSSYGTSSTTALSNFNSSSYGTNPSTMLPQFNASSYGTNPIAMLPHSNISDYSQTPTAMIPQFNIPGYATSSNVMLPDVNTSGYATDSNTTPETSDAFMRRITEGLAENLIMAGIPFPDTSSRVTCKFARTKPLVTRIFPRMKPLDTPHSTMRPVPLATLTSTVSATSMSPFEMEQMEMPLCLPCRSSSRYRL